MREMKVLRSRRCSDREGAMSQDIHKLLVDKQKEVGSLRDQPHQ